MTPFFTEHLWATAFKRNNKRIVFLRLMNHEKKIEPEVNWINRSSGAGMIIMGHKIITEDGGSSVTKI